MEFKVLDPQRHLGEWRNLRHRSTGDYSSFRGFRSDAERLFRGDYLLLRRMQITRYGLFLGSGQLAAVAMHFKTKNSLSGPRSTLGGLCFDPKLSTADLEYFGSRVIDAAGGIELAPFNGHVNLGLSVPAAETDPKKVSFLCAPGSRQTGHFFNSRNFSKARSLHALVTPLTQELRAKIVRRGGILAKGGFSSRPLSMSHYKRDIGIYNRVLNASMHNHPNFYPLDFAEEWDLWRQAFVILKPSWFRFLLRKGHEIGFCWAVPDYNLVLNSNRWDAANLAAIQLARLRRPCRARLIYSCILPEYQGQGLIKAARDAVIQEMIDSGVEEFESSYIDETNSASLANARTTGGHLSHSFYLYRSDSLR